MLICLAYGKPINVMGANLCSYPEEGCWVIRDLNREDCPPKGHGELSHYIDSIHELEIHSHVKTEERLFNTADCYF